MPDAIETRRVVSKMKYADRRMDTTYCVTWPLSRALNSEFSRLEWPINQSTINIVGSRCLLTAGGHTVVTVWSSPRAGQPPHFLCRME
jgi:hypothetical protein